MKYDASPPAGSRPNDRIASPASAPYAPAALPGALLWWLFLACSLLYLATAGSNLSGDAYAELRVTQSLLGHGWFDVPRGALGQTCAGWGCLGTDGRYYATHGVGSSLWLLPFYLLARAATALLGDPRCIAWSTAPHTTCVPVATQLIAWNTILLSAATVTLLCRLGMELGYGTRRSLGVALLYAFTSMAWPYSRFGFDVTLTGLLVLAAAREAILAGHEADLMPAGPTGDVAPGPTAMARPRSPMAPVDAAPVGAIRTGGDTSVSCSCHDTSVSGRSAVEPTATGASPPSGRGRRPIAGGSRATVERRWLRCGIFLALAILVRLPTAIVALPFLALLAHATRRQAAPARVRAALAFLLPLAACLAFTCWYNWVRFGSASPLADGHAGLRSEQPSFTPWVGLAGTLLSPGKGIFWYNPTLVLALLAIPPFRRRDPAACVLSLSVAAFSLVPYLFVRDWYGGESWGQRFVMPVLPLLFLPALQAPDVLRGVTARVLAAALVLLGIALQLAGSLVSYGLRLRWYAAHGLLDRTLWDPRYSPLGDQLGVLWSYMTHLHDATRTTAGGAESFDFWWLMLWRNDGVPAPPSLVAGGLVAVLALVACLGLLRALRRAGHAIQAAP